MTPAPPAASSPVERVRALAARPWAYALVVLALTLLAYVPALGARWIWDDDAYVTHNPVLTEEGGLRRIWTDPRSIPQWYPVVHTTFWIERRLYGLDPRGYHLVNVLLHAANAVLLAAALRRAGLPGARIAGLLFALHPVQAESVAWVTERKNVLSGLFYLGALLAWLRFEGFPEREPPERRPAGAWALAAALFLLALLSKSVTATFPCVAAVLLWAHRGRLTWRGALPLVPLLVLGAGLGLHTAALEREHVGAEGPDWDFSAADRVLIAGRALWHYARTLALPVDLVFIYPRWEIDDGAWWQYLFPAGALAAGLALFAARGRIGRWPAATAMIYAGTLFPALGFFNVYPMRYSFVADHFQYLAAAAPLALAGAGLAALRDRLAARGEMPAATYVPVALAVALLGATTFERSRSYEDEDTLWNDVLDRNPGAWIAITNVGARLLDAGKLPAAEAYARRAVELGPRSYETWNNLGKALHAQGRHDEAIEALERALEIMPRFLVARTNLGVAWSEKGDAARAEACFRAVLADRPDFPLALGNLLVLLVAEGRAAEAVDLGGRAVAMHPGDARIRTGFGRALVETGRVREGLAELAAAVRADPGLVPAWAALGRALHVYGDHDRAVQALRQAVALDPGDAELRNNLGVALRAAGRAAEAEDSYRRALLLDATNAQAWANRARLMESLGRDAVALEYWERAAALLPGHGPTLEARAMALARTGRWEEALEDLREIDAGAGLSPAGVGALLAIELDGLPPPARDATRAAALADRLLAASPEPSAERLALAARALAAAGRRAEAEALLDRAGAHPDAGEGTPGADAVRAAREAIR